MWSETGKYIGGLSGSFASSKRWGQYMYDSTHQHTFAVGEMYVGMGISADGRRGLCFSQICGLCWACAAAVVNAAAGGS